MGSKIKINRSLQVYHKPVKTVSYQCRALPCLHDIEVEENDDYFYLDLCLCVFVWLWVWVGVLVYIPVICPHNDSKILACFS